jgi:pimeloyl-ACP methyl ester carboxylesterase
MHINCTGPANGGPTLVLDHGGGGLGSGDWASVQPELARFARVCSYDRPGYGWSELSPARRTVDHETDELRALLDAANVPGPYVLVADSLGSYTSRTFATRYPERVEGLVLVDSSTEGEWQIPDIRAFNRKFGVLTASARVAAPIGLWRALGESGVAAHPLLPYIAADQRERERHTTYRSAYWRSIYQETGLWNLDVSAAQLHATRRFLDALPIVILTAGEGYPTEAYRQGWLEQQEDLRRLSSRTVQHVIPATHISILTDQRQYVVDAVHEILRMIHSPALADQSRTAA